jgi:hypothetical protein
MFRKLWTTTILMVIVSFISLMVVAVRAVVCLFTILVRYRVKSEAARAAVEWRI